MADPVPLTTADAYQELGESDALFRAVFEWAPIGISVTDLNGEHIRNNRRRCELLGYTEDELEDLPFSAFTHPDDVAIERPLYEEIVAGTREQYEIDKRYIHKAGTIISVHVTVARVPDDTGETRFVVAMIEDIGERKRAAAALEHRAYHDDLTDLPNRALLADRLRQALATARRRNEQVAVLFLDLDGLKGVNDSLGHESGDRLLKEVAGRLTAIVRESDTVARLSGDEFTVILPNVGSIDNARDVAAKILQTVAAISSIDDHPIIISTSLGISLYPRDGDDAETLLHRADEAMYDAKGAGKNRAAIFQAKRRG
jgi:diguanylate cyclase (GGDEF)-like protein/PAS domain S-box-containing protein